jgi:hypothetical protein
MGPCNVLVTGDYVLDHHIYEGKRQHFCDRRHRGVHEVEELGGAALIHYLLAELQRGVTSHLSVAVDGNRKLGLPGPLPSELSAYAIWRPFGVGKDASPEKAIWRTEDAMGFGCLTEKPVAFDWPENKALPDRPDVVVLSDGGMRFREETKLWPREAVLDQAKWIVLKTSHPFAEGKLWDRLTRADSRGKLVVVVSSEELRKGPARVSSGLSWDATVETVLSALAPGEAYEALTRCRHLVIAFGTEGGLWLEVGDTFEQAKAHLVYDAAFVEGEHRKPETKGTAFGALSCLTASVVWHLALASVEPPDLETAMEGGLSAIYDLFTRGHGRAAVPGEGFPAKRLAKAISEATCRYARISFRATAPSAPPPCAAVTPTAPGRVCWSLMHEAFQHQGQKCPAPAWDLAERVARRGPIAIGSLPHLSIGNLTSADRREIEALRVLRHLVLDYKNRPASECRKPLSIGVFGPPGAGKSFAVKEIAQALMGEKEWKEGWMEFNLSQFTSETTDDLIGAFHQIRDRVLKALTPVAFFDEFDSHKYEWLQYLLAPMQDGAFQQGQATHPIGKCIFVFAGATSWTFESFGPPEGSGAAYDDFKMAKGPDFKSRLDGFLDVLGPNQRQLIAVDQTKQSYTQTPDPCDIFYPVRRALFVRGELRCKRDEKLDIDAGLLRALLRIGKYKHGARSLSKLVEPLRDSRPGTVYRSLLPSRQQIDLHVDAAEFLRECAIASSRPAQRDLANVEEVAAAIHQTYRELGKAQGWLKEGEENDVDYNKLHEFYKQSNIAAATRMPQVLALIGLGLENGSSTPPERDDIRLRIESNLELLAEYEHEGWMDWLLDQGWQYGPQKPRTELTKAPDPEKRFHPCLKPYTELSDEERNKDRNSVRHFFDVAHGAGLKIVVTQ